MSCYINRRDLLIRAQARTRARARILQEPQESLRRA